MKKSIILLITLLIAYTSVNAQYGRNSQYLIGYQWYPADTLYDFYNMSYMQFRDTGLTFSTRFFVPYQFSNSQTFSYTDVNGKPLLQWQGCALLESENFTIVENGYFPHKNEIMECKLNIEDTNELILKFYTNPFGSFILNINHSDDSLYVIYQRLIDLENAKLYAAKVNKNQQNQYYVAEKEIDISEGINYSFSSTQVIRHANGKDWWILYSDMSIRQNFYAVLLDHDGFHPPVLSHIPEWEPIDLFDYMVVSADGTKIAMTSARSDFIVLNFDRCFGKFTYSNHGHIPHLVTGELDRELFHFVEFSPSGQHLYANTEMAIYQYDLYANKVNNSRKTIAVFDTTGLTPFEQQGYFSNPIRAPNGYLYYWSGNGVPRIHRIEFPDKPGDACNFTQGHTVSPVYTSWMTQHLINYDLGPLPEGSCQEISTQQELQLDGIIPYPNPVKDRFKLSIPHNITVHQCDLLSVSGTTIHSFQRDKIDQQDFDISHLPPGIYILKINGQIIDKIVKV